ncbi:MAG: hypothetical protein K8U03_25230 [Planctomycetia bacterium]|nr:hypothetical protein [Planctomycetia bacterium]
MAKKARTKAAPSSDAASAGRGSKTAAIKSYMAAHKGAMPKEIVAALKEQGVEVSPNLVSIIRAKLKVKGFRKNKKSSGGADTGGATTSSAGNASALEAALTLYKAARLSPDGNSTKTRQAFLLLVETFG